MKNGNFIHNYINLVCIDANVLFLADINKKNANICMQNMNFCLDKY